MSFTYPGSSRPALCNVSFSIKPGERIALVGENGAGKSTLVKLLMGLYKPTQGRITVDGIDLNELSPLDWQRRFGVVFQDFIRFETTVRENVSFGSLEKAKQPGAIEAAVAQAGATHLVETLPNSWDTHLGKSYRDGTDLSGGEWQKLAIARAYMRTAQILVLDEPASALDAKAEADVYRHFAQMGAGKTMFLISHRLGSCQLADRVLVFKDGHLIEEGDHQTLMASQGEYADMYQQQAAWYR